MSNLNSKSLMLLTTGLAVFWGLALQFLFPSTELNESVMAGAPATKTATDVPPFVMGTPSHIELDNELADRLLAESYIYGGDLRTSKKMDAPYGVATDQNGYVYVTDGKNNRVQVFRPNKKYLTSITSGFNLPYGVAVDFNGNIFVTDFYNHRVKKFDSNFNLVKSWGGQGTKPGKFMYPAGIAVDYAGIVFVTDVGNNRVQVFTNDGVPLSQFGSRGSGKNNFINPYGIAVDDFYTVYVSDTGNHRIQKLQLDINYGMTQVKSWGCCGSANGKLKFPRTIAVDQDRNVYVADSGNNRIQKFTHNGKFLATWNGTSSSKGIFSQPSGVAAKVDGMRVYVADTGKDRSQEWCKVACATPTPTLSPTPTPIAWARSFGGTGYDNPLEIVPSPEGGAVVVGFTDSFGAGSNDVWVLKLSKFGGVEWQKTYGGENSDVGTAITESPDGGYVIAGWTMSYGPSNLNGWVIKLNNTGEIQWQKTYGESQADSFYAISPTSDQGYVIAGATQSFGAVGNDMWLVRVDGSGNVIWSKSYGGSGSDIAHSVIQSSDGGFVIVGSTESFGAGAHDVWVRKVDASGNLNWQMVEGGGGTDLGLSVAKDTSGNFLVTGYTGSSGDGIEFLILKIDSSGNVVWRKTYGSDADEGYAVITTEDGGSIVAGQSFGFGVLVKLDQSGNTQWKKRYGGGGYDEIQDLVRTSDGGYALTGLTFSYGAGDADFWVLKIDGEGNLRSCTIVGNPSGSMETSLTQSGSVVATIRNPTVIVSNSNTIPIDTNATIATQCAP